LSKKKSGNSPLDSNPELMKKREELRGFEEIIDLIPGSRFQSKQKVDPKLNEDFELLNLLENEYQRLLQLESFFGEKLSNMEKYSQSDELVEMQNSHLESMKKQMIRVQVEPDSQMNKNLSIILNQYFSK
jgi:hypothetical protein